MCIYKMPVQDKRPITLYLLSLWTVAIYLNRQHIRQWRCNFRSLQQEKAGMGGAGGGVCGERCSALMGKTLMTWHNIS